MQRRELHIEKWYAPIDAMIALDAHTVLVAGYLDYALRSQDQLFLGDQPIAKPYSGFSVPGAQGNYMICLLRLAKGRVSKKAHAVTITRAGNIIEWQAANGTPVFTSPIAVDILLAACPQEAYPRLYGLLAYYMRQNPQHQTSGATHALFAALRKKITRRHAQLVRHYWLSKEHLYVEYISASLLSAMAVTLCSTAKVNCATLTLLQQEPHNQGILTRAYIHIPGAMESSTTDGLSIALHNEQHSFFVDGVVPLKMDNSAIQMADMRDIILQKLLPGVTEASDRILLEDALHRVQQQIAQHSCLAEHSCFGAGVASPQLSIVITLYASYDCIRQQLAAFSMDPFFKQCELVYVLDSPQHAVALKQLVRELSVLNNTSVTLAVMPANLGTASAINAGVAVARAPTLVIMDSDMLLPVNNAGHSWLEALHRLHEATTSPHVIIPAQKDAAQLAPQGVVAYRYEHDEVTLLTKDNAAKQKRPLPDGSCFSIAKKYFKKLGGIPAQDIVCGYERLAFMHRCAEAGIKPVILEKSAPMVHLGGMSANQHPSHSEVLQHINWRAHCLRWKKYIRQVANAPR